MPPLPAFRPCGFSCLSRQPSTLGGGSPKSKQRKNRGLFRSPECDRSCSFHPSFSSPLLVFLFQVPGLHSAIGHAPSLSFLHKQESTPPGLPEPPKPNPHLLKSADPVSGPPERLAGHHRLRASQDLRYGINTGRPTYSPLAIRSRTASACCNG